LPSAEVVIKVCEDKCIYSEKREKTCEEVIKEMEKQIKKDPPPDAFD